MYCLRMLYLDILAEDKVGELEVGSRTMRKMDQQKAIYALAILIEDHQVCEVPVGRIFRNLLQRKALQRTLSDYRLVFRCLLLFPTFETYSLFSIHRK